MWITRRNDLNILVKKFGTRIRRHSISMNLPCKTNLIGTTSMILTCASLLPNVLIAIVSFRNVGKLKDLRRYSLI